jgi:hypothetical protein
MKIAILNASNPKTVHLESDEYVDYRDGRRSCFSGDKCLKQIRSWHGWAYALETEFFVYAKNNWQGCFQYDALIVLVNRDIKELIPLLKKLKLMKKKVAISFHESVSDMLVGSGLSNENLPQRWIDLFQLVQESDFYLNIFYQSQDFFNGWFGDNKVKFANHGAPIDWNHGFTIPYDERPNDILIGTRTFGQRIPRNSFISLGVMNGFAEKFNLKVSYVSEDGNINELINKLGLKHVSCYQGPFASWEEWLKFVAKHKIMFHSENSLNLGQICFDAALVDVMCFGSNTWNNMRLKTDNANQREIFDYLFDPSLRSQKNQHFLENFKKSIHPDVIKEELINVFK